MNHTNLDTEAFQYNHIFNLLRDIFGFNEIKDGDFVKDTIKTVYYTHLTLPTNLRE